MPVHSTCEVLVVGAGPAGLTAAIYLARSRRSLQLLDLGLSRARYIPVSRNCPGFAHGVSGTELLAELREQAARHGVQARQACVRTLRRDGEAFVADVDGHKLAAQQVILATGLEDVLPPWSGVETAVHRGIVRLCAVCDAFETAGKRVAVFGPAQEVAAHARYLRAFSAEVWAIVADAGTPPAAHMAELRALGVPVVPAPRSVRLVENGVEMENQCGGSLRCDVIYPFLGARPHSQLARALGARCDDEGYIAVDAHQRTSVPGLYAVGDVVKALNQIAVAMGHAAIAASAIHNELPHRALRK